MARKTKKILGAGKPKKTNFTRVKLSFHVLNKAIVRLVARFIRSNREEKPKTSNRFFTNLEIF